MRVKWARAIITAGILLAASVVFVDPGLRHAVLGVFRLATILRIRHVVRSMGVWGPVLVMGLMILHSVMFVPAEFITISSLVIFGPIWGLVYAWVGAMLGASVSFGLARLWGRPVVTHFVSPGTLLRLDGFIQREGAVGMLTLRLIPLVSFNALNYAAGLTQMTWRQFLWTTGLGILPMEVLLALLYHSAHGKSGAVIGLTVFGLALLAGLLIRGRLVRKYGRFSHRK